MKIQETVLTKDKKSSNDTTNRVNRGNNRLANLNRNTSTNANTNNGWRPTLCLYCNAIIVHSHHGHCDRCY